MLQGQSWLSSTSAPCFSVFLMFFLCGVTPLLTIPIMDGMDGMDGMVGMDGMDGMVIIGRMYSKHCTDWWTVGKDIRMIFVFKINVWVIVKWLHSIQEWFLLLSHKMMFFSCPFGWPKNFSISYQLYQLLEKPTNWFSALWNWRINQFLPPLWSFRS